MRKAKELIGKPIYGVTDGRQIGSVKDLFVDLELALLKGIYLGREGLINRKVQFIAREDVAVFGIDAVLTTGSDVASDNSQVPKVDMWLRRDQLQGREVETSGGTKVGTVGDLLFDEQAAVAGVTLARVHVAGPIAENKMVLKSAITETGGREGVMVIDLTLAEMSASGETQEPAAGAPAAGAPAAGAPAAEAQAAEAQAAEAQAAEAQAAEAPAAEDAETPVETTGEESEDPPQIESA